MNYIKLEIIFVLILSIYGVMIMFLTPPLQSPDENGHFSASYSLSELHITGGTVNGETGGGGGIICNENVRNFIQYYDKKFVGKPESKYTYNDMYLDSYVNDKYGDSSKITVYPYWKLGYGVIKYSIQAVGIAFGKILLDNYTPYNAIMFARFFNLMFFILIVYIALKITPVYKNTIFLIATMPMTVSLAASVSRDAGLIAISILYFAYLFMIIQNKEYKISCKDIIYLSIIGVCFYDFKVVMLPFLLLVIFIDKSKFTSLKQRLSFYIIPIICILIIFLFNQLTQYKDISHPNVYEQIEYLKHNIIQIPSIIYNTIKTYHVFYKNSLYGNLGLLDVSFPRIMLALFYIALFLVAIYDGLTSKKMSYKIISTSFAISVAVFIVLIMYFYITWTPLPDIAGIGVNYSTGFQGRYLIPFMTFCLLIFALFSQKNNKIQMFNKQIYGLVVITGLLNMNITVLILLLRYWI